MVQKIQSGAQRRVVIAGGKGMIGSACARLLKELNYEVVILSRSASPGRRDVVQWTPSKRWISTNVVDGAHAVINLTGASIAGRRWTENYKKALHDSRVVPADFLRELIGEAEHKPQVYIGASGVGIYGNSGSDPVTEDDALDNERFVVALANAWERAHRAIEPLSRVVVFRIGVVLARTGGFYERMRLPARFGIFPVFSGGHQMLSWIHLDDLVQIIARAIARAEFDGTVNAVSDTPLSYRSFAREHRKATGHAGLIIAIPAFVARALFGEMSSVLLDSCHASNQKLRGLGYECTFPDAPAALAEICRKD